MSFINLRDYYPAFYAADFLISAPDELAKLLMQWEREEKTYERQRYRNKAHYSLDRGDGIEHRIQCTAPSPSEIYERKVIFEQLYAAILALPDKQAKRVFAHYFLGMSKAAIACAERVSRNVVCASIKRGLRNLEKIIKNFEA